MEKNRNIIFAFYIALSLVVILCSLPSFSLQNIGYTLIMVELVIAYIARARFPRNESYEENHTTYVIRTIWIYTTVATLGMIIISVNVTMHGNAESLNAISDAMLSGATPDDVQMAQSFRHYASDNEQLLIEQSRLWLFPAQLYLVWRIMQGGGRAFKSYRIANPKKWL